MKYGRRGVAVRFLDVRLAAVGGPELNPQVCARRVRRARTIPGVDAGAGSSARPAGPERARGSLRPFWVLMALLSTLGAVSGCSGAPSASPTLSPLPTASSTPTGSPTASSPTTAASTSVTSPATAGSGAPPLDTPFTREGAESFARYWFAEFDRAYAQLDPSIIAAISTPTCVSCQAYLRDLRDTKAAGQSYQQGERALLFVVSALFEGNSTSVLVTFATKELLVVDASGVVIQRLPAEPKVVVDVDLSRRGTSWVVREVTRT